MLVSISSLVNFAGAEWSRRTRQGDLQWQGALRNLSRAAFIHRTRVVDAHSRGNGHRRFPGEPLPRRQVLSHDAAQGTFYRTKGGFYHDGRFATLNDVIAHYEDLLGLNLTEIENADLIEYLKSL